MPETIELDEVISHRLLPQVIGSNGKIVGVEGGQIVYRNEQDIAAAIAAAIAALVDSAPGALDTLNELAAALGDDADFATTVTNALAAKQATISGASLSNVTPAEDDKVLHQDTSDSDNLKTSTAIAISGLITGGKRITVSDSEPSSPATGDLWVDTN